MNEITKSAEDTRREAEAWLSRSLAWERTLDRLRGDEPADPPAAEVVPAHRAAA